MRKIPISVWICLVVLLLWYSAFFAAYLWMQAHWFLKPSHIARESELFQTLQQANEKAPGEEIHINLKDIYGHDVKRFALQCPYGNPEFTAKRLGVDVEDLPGLRAYMELNSETVAGLILDHGDDNYEISEWDFRSIEWCQRYEFNLGWYSDLNVTFVEREGDPSYVPSFAALIEPPMEIAY